MSIFNLTLLTPLALLGLAALAVPIYLHMRHKPRAEVFKFPAIDFLLQAQKKRKRRLRVEQWPLMALRIIVIILLAMLFAKPFLESDLSAINTAADRPIILILDDSASMLAGPTTGRYFYEAVNEIEEVLESRPGAAPTYLLTAGKPKAFLEQNTAAALRGSARALKPSMQGHTLDAAYNTALDLIQTNNLEDAVIRIFSDGSRSAWQRIPGEKPAKIDVIYSPMRDPSKPINNLGVAEVFQSPGDHNALEVGIFNGGSQPAQADINLLDQTDRDLLSYELRIEASSRMNHRFGLGETLPATVKIQLPADDFDLDNQALFAPRNSELIRVLIVDGDPDPDAIRAENFFFFNSLGAEESEQYGFTLETVTPAGFNKAAMERADVIALLNVDLPDSALLREATSKNKGILLGMGNRIEFEDWNKFLAEWDLKIWETKQLDPAQPVAFRDPSHPMWPPIDSDSWRGYFDQVGIRAFRLVSVGTSRFDSPLTLADGSPMLLTKDLLPGRLAIWTSSLDLDWNNFPLQIGYVPFNRQLTSWLAGRDQNDQQLSMTVDEAVSRGIADQLTPKFISPVFDDIDAEGPFPGIYTLSDENSTRFVQLHLDTSELDFQPLLTDESGEGENSATAAAGFRGHYRADLAPRLQWFLFILILVETLIAGRISLSWGNR